MSCMKCVTSFVVCLICGSSLFGQNLPPAEQRRETPSGTPGLERPSGPFIRICGPKTPAPCATPPRAVFSPSPEYSDEARDAHYEGTCVLWLWVGTDGDPHSVRVARGLGHGLDEKAVDAVKKWKFEPAMMNREPVAVQINVEVSFRLSAVAVSPTSAQVITGSQQQFSAIVSILSEPTKSAVNWSLSGPGCVASACGNISPDGLYTAPFGVPNPPIIILTATSATDPNQKGSAKITILPRASR